MGERAGGFMDCPVCGCRVEPPTNGFVIECGCCGTIWVQAADDTLERVLVGPEG